MEDYTLQVMTLDDYPEVWELWMGIKGFAIRSVDDSYEGVERFLRRNPTTSVVARSTADGSIIGSILCGHDGRRGSFYHVCVREDWRRHGIGQAMVEFCVDALKKEKISKITLIAFTSNEAGNAFWQGLKWSMRHDVNTYDLITNEKNIVHFNV